MGTRDSPTRFRYVDSDNPWIRFLYLPLVVAALLLHMARPLHMFPNEWLGHLVGWPVLAVAVVAAARGRIFGALPIATVAIALLFNSVWPLIFLAAGVVLVIRMLHIQGPGWPKRS